MMERSRSKRNYYYDQDYDSETLARTRPRYNDQYSNRHRDAYGGAGRRYLKIHQDAPVTVTTSYRILCHDLRTGSVIGKFGSIIKSIRQHTGAWINVHDLVPGDEERIIEISDTRRRDPEGRMPSFSPAQEALLLINERILESDAACRVAAAEEYGGGGRNWDRVATRLVVPNMHVGCLLGTRGKIIEQMRMETKTQIRVLPRDHNLLRCVSMSEEIVQVTGDINAVKNALEVISSLLRESQHPDRSHFHGREHSPECFFSPDDNYIPRGGSLRSSVEAAAFGSRGSATNARNNNYPSSGAPVANDAQPFYGEGLVFRIVCPVEKVDHIIGESYRFVEFLQNDVGVDIKVTDPIGGSEERIIIITSEEGPDNELFPAQEALLHIQTRIVNLVLDKDNTITTRLVIPSSDIEWLDGKYGSLSEIKRLTGANIQILPREERPLCVAKTDELVQIVGEIKAARDAVVEVTSRLRSYLYRDFIQRDTVPPPAPLSSMEASSSNTIALATETSTIYQNAQTVAAAVLPSKMETGGSSAEVGKQKDNQRRDDLLSGLNRITVPSVTRSILEVVLPDYAVPRLLARSKSKLSQISELSGANVTLVEDRPDMTEKIIQLSGTPEQAERAQSLLQGFILSTQEDGP
ncbi:PREDICTED: KH domain-containing protein HEN4-like [Lupinus angustifolius]|uniref:KH domain-containing protein HEN4-like n=1 Tax=Lupinus angustifolius TaxID=3871 RepID=UPI00092F829C|nr:PREDICTED: KH domain-containing protein HEN4-like [Lupinus angustifolius]